MGLTRGQEINYKNLNNAYVSAVGGGNLIGDYTINGKLNVANSIIDFEGIELNILATGDRITKLDFHSDAVHSDYSARIIRNAGENASFQIINIGNGNIELISDKNIILYTDETHEVANIETNKIELLENKINIISYSSLPAEGSIPENNLFVFGSGTDRHIRILTANDGYTKAEIRIVNNNTSNGDIYFYTGNSNAAPSERVRIQHDGLTVIQHVQIIQAPEIQATELYLNYNQNGADSSIIVVRNGTSNALLKWNESTEEWEAGTSSTFPIFTGLNSKKQARFYFGTEDPTNTDRLNYDGYFYATKVYNAVYNDLAEFMKTLEESNPGDVMVQTNSGLKKSSKRAMANVVGVHSDTFGFALGADSKDNKVPIGISGKVKVKVTGRVKAGQELVSYKNGTAIRANIFEKIFKRSAIIGKALENGKNTKIWMLIK